MRNRIIIRQVGSSWHVEVDGQREAKFPELARACDYVESRYGYARIQREEALKECQEAMCSCEGPNEANSFKGFVCEVCTATAKTEAALC